MRNFLFAWPEPSDFYNFIWVPAKTSASYGFKIYKAVLAMYFFGWLLVDLNFWYFELGIIEYYLIYLTNWSFLVFQVHLFLSTATAIFKTDEHSAVLKIHWAVQNLIMTMNILVAVAYWLMVYDFSKGLPTLRNSHKHLINAFVIFVDFCITKTPHRLEHLWLSMVYVSAYQIFNVIFYLSGATNDSGCRCVYKMLNYNENFPTAIRNVFLMYAGLPAIHLLLHGAFRLKLLCQSKLFKPPSTPVIQIQVKEKQTQT